MTDLVSQLVGALEECLDDSRSVLADMEQKYGTNYRQDRLEFHRQVIAAAEAALTAAKAGGWLPIETAPKDGTRILVWRKHATRPLIARYQKDFEWFEDEDGVHLYHLIYWQPLPNPPKEQSAGGLGSVDAVANPLSPT